MQQGAAFADEASVLELGRKRVDPLHSSHATPPAQGMGVLWMRGRARQTVQILATRGGRRHVELWVCRRV